MHPGHGEIKGKKDLRRTRQGRFVIKSRAGHQMLLELEIVFREFDTEKNCAEQNGKQQEVNNRLASAELRAAHGEGHRKAAADQHRRVDRSKPDIQVIARAGESLRVSVSVERVTREHPAEEHHLRPQKHPHADPCSIVLLLDVVELMSLDYA